MFLIYCFIAFGLFSNIVTAKGVAKILIRNEKDLNIYIYIYTLYLFEIYNQINLYMKFI